MITELRPVGEHVTARPSKGGIDRAWQAPPSWSRKFYGTGTEALAAACCASVVAKGLARPEIVIPAYTCPAVVSAVEYAGATPVLADFVPNRPFLDTENLSRAINKSTVAVIPVNFLGIPERLDLIKSVAGETGAFVIYDHCQGFPSSSESTTIADFLAFSFGRGKPAASLAGGALLARETTELTNCLPQPGKRVGPASRARVAAYNWLIRPPFYGLPKRLPFLHVGETRYRKLANLSGLDSSGVDRIAANLERFDTTPAPIQKQLATILEGLQGVVDLVLESGSCELRQLRYAVLMPTKKTRDLVMSRLTEEGLGASALYETPLNQISGLHGVFSKSTRNPNAEDFARRLLTLPVHSAVQDTHLKRIERILRDGVGDGS